MPVAVPLAIMGSAAIGAAASSSAANKTAKAAQATTASNNALQQTVYNQNTANMQPYMQGGGRAFDAWQSFMGLGSPAGGQSSGSPSVFQAGLNGNALAAAPNALSGYDQFKNSMGYQTGLDEGSRALNNRLASRGQLFSGAAGREAIRYGQNYANTFANGWADRLMQGTQVGAGAANALAGVGSSYANNVGQNNNNALNASAAANSANGAAIGDLAGNAASAAAYYYGNRAPSTASSYAGQGGYGRPVSW